MCGRCNPNLHHSSTRPGERGDQAKRGESILKASERIVKLLNDPQNSPLACEGCLGRGQRPLLVALGEAVLGLLAAVDAEGGGPAPRPFECADSDAAPACPYNGKLAEPACCRLKAGPREAATSCCWLFLERIGQEVHT